MKTLTYFQYQQRLLEYFSEDHGGKFKLSQHGACTTFNGIEIKTDTHNPHKISINQNTHTRLAIKKLCEKFNLNSVIKRDNLPTYETKLPLTEKKATLCDADEIKEYQSIVGELTWIAVQTRAATVFSPWVPTVMSFFLRSTIPWTW